MRNFLSTGNSILMSKNVLSLHVEKNDKIDLA